MTATTPESSVTTDPIPVVHPKIAVPARERRRDVPKGAPFVRQDAPRLLKVFVSLAFVAVLVGLLGLSVERFHPNWLSTLRDTASSPTKQAVATAHHHKKKIAPVPVKGVVLKNSSTARVIYDVASEEFSLQVAVTDRCWIEIRTPSGTGRLAFAKTLSSGEKMAPVKVSESASLVLGGRASVVDVLVHGKVIGRVLSPALGRYYIFNSTPH